MSMTRYPYLLVNARVITLDPSCPRADAIYIDGSRLRFVGRRQTLSASSRGLHIVDCRGAAIIPGIHDAHMHLRAMAGGALSIDCSPEAAGSIEALVSNLSARARLVKPGTWLRAVGYRESELAERRHPNRWDLDRVSREHPLRLTHASLHVAVVSSLGLRMAGITRESSPISGGTIERDSTGEPTGVLFGYNRYLSRVLPRHSAEEFELGVKTAAGNLLRQGITAVTDASPDNGISEWKLISSWQERGLLPLRVCMMTSAESGPAIAQMEANETLLPGPVKIMQSQSGGQLCPSPEILAETVTELHRQGFCTAIHALDEAEILSAIHAIEAALIANPRRLGHRVEHCAVCPPAFKDEIVKVGAAVTTNPAFLHYGGSRYLCEHDSHKWDWIYPVGSLSRRGIKVAAGSDSPVAPVNLGASIHAMVTRESREGHIIAAKEVVTRLEALNILCRHGTELMPRAWPIGQLKPGNWADFVILNGNPTSVSHDALLALRPLACILGGNLVWWDPTTSDLDLSKLPSDQGNVNGASRDPGRRVTSGR